MIIDQQAVPSCTVTIGSLEGAEIITIEGLSAGRDHPVQQAWAAEQVTQCGYCEPGLILTVAALLKANPRPTDADVDALPNICRCGIGPRVKKAIARASVAMTAGQGPGSIARQAPAQAERTEPERFSNRSSGEAQNRP